MNRVTRVNHSDHGDLRGVLGVQVRAYDEFRRKRGGDAPPAHSAHDCCATRKVCARHRNPKQNETTRCDYISVSLVASRVDNQNIVIFPQRATIKILQRAG
eukprot:6824479-Pyramimonas_sp.AAC.1